VALNSEPVGSVVLITGPAAAGKSSVADRLARTHSGPALHVSLDDIRDLVKSGYADPSDGWTDVAERQYELARASCASVARTYAAQNYLCVLDDAVFPDWPEVGLDRWLDELRGFRVDFIAVIARFEVLLNRNEHRQGHRRLAPEMLRVIHDRMLGWRERDFPVVDSSDLTLEQTVEQVRARVSHRPARHAGA
jgi:chloramphenicol 3-O-phosphotransferase